MDELKALFEKRTSIRAFEEFKIPKVAMDTIHSAILNTPTSYNGQQFSVIEISDQNIKNKLYEITNQHQIKTCDKFLVFCVDYFKIQALAKAKEAYIPHYTDTLDGVMVGVIDASIAMMNAIVAAQSCGIGSCCVGYVRTANPSLVAEILKIPKGVFVVCGLALGVPKEFPDFKPKQQESLVIHHNRYCVDNVVTEMETYDKTIVEYNKNRAGQTSNNDWLYHILNYYREAMSYNIKDYIVAQGFDVLK